MKIKLFSSDFPSSLQSEIDLWIRSYNPKIVNVKTTNFGTHSILITVLYEI